MPEPPQVDVPVQQSYPPMGIAVRSGLPHPAAYAAQAPGQYAMQPPRPGGGFGNFERPLGNNPDVKRRYLQELQEQAAADRAKRNEGRPRPQQEGGQDFGLYGFAQQPLAIGLADPPLSIAALQPVPSAAAAGSNPQDAKRRYAAELRAQA